MQVHARTRSTGRRESSSVINGLIKIDLPRTDPSCAVYQIEDTPIAGLYSKYRVSVLDYGSDDLRVQSGPDANINA
jgi:hypothetical protein